MFAINGQIALYFLFITFNSHDQNLWPGHCLLPYVCFLQHNRKRKKNTQGKSQEEDKASDKLGDFPHQKLLTLMQQWIENPIEWNNSIFIVMIIQTWWDFLFLSETLYLGKLPQALTAFIRVNLAKAAVTFPLLNSLYSHRGRSS